LLRIRKTLQKAMAKRKERKASTRSVRRRLQSNKRKESNFSKTANHTVSKRIIESAKAQRLGIALEDLMGIRGGKRFRRSQRYLQHSWAFYDLQQKIVYKARLAGLPVVFVPAAYTSQECPGCGYCAKHNRVSQSSFVCRQCAFAAHADFVGACNIASRAIVSLPNAREHHSTGKSTGSSVGR
jgi:IS605 OrfB family transposase